MAIVEQHVTRMRQAWLPSIPLVGEQPVRCRLVRVGFSGSPTFPAACPCTVKVLIGEQVRLTRLIDDGVREHGGDIPCSNGSRFSPKVVGDQISSSVQRLQQQPPQQLL